MDLNKLLGALTPQIYANLCRAVELGRWPDGKPLSAQQRALCLQAVIAYDASRKPENERVGYIPPKVLGARIATGNVSDVAASGATGEKMTGEKDKPVRWRH